MVRPPAAPLCAVHPGLFGMPSTATLLYRRINHFNILWAKSARELAEWHNTVQRVALEQPCSRTLDTGSTRAVPVQHHHCPPGPSPSVPASTAAAINAW
ncbi:hypothetical protein [Streptomyces sp. NPDC006510]|uniref:hypothetical protein n=1 Tax=Streptomyces sp. NPDC006510 TaxID=3155600 RepID=UPI0033A70EA6